ncbi:hypothetical protein MtrunA17_Chr6g0452301 [Medicago truncatula]|uniref:Uncharacterized protein n=1 Tax=Medicago truncatula TaxID=3880 RepID=A0A396HBF3_MEDTR|nr:hypothetical protein MtrunA17_Chr6g0452301 [Medicago truncatula]
MQLNLSIFCCSFYHGMKIMELDPMKGTSDLNSLICCSNCVVNINCNLFKSEMWKIINLKIHFSIVINISHPYLF